MQYEALKETNFRLEALGVQILPMPSPLGAPRQKPSQWAYGTCGGIGLKKRGFLEAGQRPPGATGSQGPQMVEYCLERISQDPQGLRAGAAPP